MKRSSSNVTVLNDAAYRKYAGEIAAVSFGKGVERRILAHAETGEELARQVDAMGLDPKDYIIEYLPRLDAFSI